MSTVPKPSATVVLLRDVREGLELLLLQRAPRREGAPGPWVFPGGKVEKADRTGPSGDPLESARVAAVRETREEAGLELEGSRLVPISRWITPDLTPRRFDTWFFLGRIAPQEQVVVDGGEICDHRWLRPASALDAYRRGELDLAPPQFVTVTWLEAHRSAQEAIETLGRAPVPEFRPRICRLPRGACILYPGDAGYDDGEVERPGPRHRLWALGEGWRYERG